MAHARSAGAAAFIAPRTGQSSRKPAWMAILSCLFLAACGGGGGSNDGTLVTRSGVAVTGIADDGTASSPIAGGTCVARTLAGAVVSSATTGSDGSYLLLVDPGQRVYISCSDAGRTNLAIRTFASTEGLAEGADLGGQDVLPATSVIARIVAQEAADDPTLDARARFTELRARLLPFESGQPALDADLQLLADVSTTTYDRLRDTGVDVEFEAVLADLYDDGVLDLVTDDPVVDAVNAAVAALETAAGRLVEDAVLSTHPAFDLSVINVGGGASALLDVARLVARLDGLRDAGDDMDGILTVAAGNTMAPSKELQVSLETLDDFYDGLALEGLGLDTHAFGPLDHAYGPNALVAQLGSVTTPLVSLLTDVDFDSENGLADLAARGRLTRALLLEERARRIAVLSASDPQLLDKASLRRLVALTGDARIARLQAGIDAARVSGARIIVLLAGIETLADIADTAAALSGVDLIVGLPDLEGITVPTSGSGASPVATVSVPDADGNAIPIVPAVGRFAGLVRMQLQLDPLGRLAPASIVVEADLVASDAPADADLQASVVQPVRDGLDLLDATGLAETRVELDPRADSLNAGETNWGDLLAESVLSTSRANASLFRVPAPLASLVDSASITSAALIPVGNLDRGDAYDLLPGVRLVGVLQAVTPADLKRLLEFSFANRGTGLFAQVAGIEIEFDPDGTPQELDADGTVLVEGSRVVNVNQRGGNPIIEAGVPRTDGRTIPLGISAEIADSYPLGALQPVFVGLSINQGFDVFLTSALENTVRNDDFPAGGDGRIVEVAP
ncbi:MAG TPA: 5'-nucleotidase C-terminal domain-containing protein [Pseudomonadales bacterium]|nr:5'-nucleotidase C-terminal domain-containing protein [Pseudomonadales bacterium]